MSTSPSPTPYSNRPWWGRAWEITYQPMSSGVPTGDPITLSASKWDPETLRMTFHASLVAGLSWWWADIAVYNTDRILEQRLLKGAKALGTAKSADDQVLRQGDWVTVAAGYQYHFNPDASIIFEGEVFQPMWERENAIDYKITLRCVVGKEATINFLSYSESDATASQSEIVRKMAAQAHVDCPDDGSIDDDMMQKTFPRGKVVFTDLKTFLNQVAQDHRDKLFQMWIAPQGLNARTLYPTKQTPDLIYAPMPAPGNPQPKLDPTTTQTLIGVPQQTQYGITFRVLLDARLKVGSLIRLDKSVINQLPNMPGPKGSFHRLEGSGLYVVQQVDHFGDTRGNDWYSECVCLTQGFWDQSGGALGAAATITNP